MTDLEIPEYVSAEEGFDYALRSYLQQEERRKVAFLFEQAKDRQYLGNNKWLIDGYEVAIPPHLLPAEDK